MPYIKPDDRRIFDEITEKLNPTTEGDLNYIITTICLDFAVPISYSKINDVIGVLECAKLELYRRLAAPYEDKKALENGDVY